MSSSTGLSSFIPLLSIARYSVTSVIRKAIADCHAQTFQNVHTHSPPLFHYLDNCDIWDRSVRDITQAFRSSFTLSFYGYWDTLPGVRRPGCEVSPSPPFRTEVRNGATALLPSYASTMWPGKTVPFTFDLSLFKVCLKHLSQRYLASLPRHVHSNASNRYVHWSLKLPDIS